MGEVNNNFTKVSEFIIVGFPDLQQEYFHLVAWIFFLLYVITVVGNSILVVIFSLEPSLQKPMYIIMVSLALSDIGKYDILNAKLFLLVIPIFSLVFCIFPPYRLCYGGFTKTDCSVLVERWDYWHSHLFFPNTHDTLLWEPKLPYFTYHGIGPMSSCLFSFQV